MASFIEKRKVDEYLKRIKQGESSALADLYELTAKKLYSLCYTYMHNHHDSEDALSETYLAIVRNLEKYKGKSGYNWIYTIAKNICLNMLLKNSRAESVDFEDEETVNSLPVLYSDEIKIYDESGIIAFSEKLLGENEFRIVIMHAVNEMRFAEIAQIIGGLESTVRWQYNNAIKKIKNAYERGQAK